MHVIITIIMITSTAMLLQDTTITVMRTGITPIIMTIRLMITRLTTPRAWTAAPTRRASRSRA